MLKKSDWPHAPVHYLEDRGTFMVTAATFGRLPLLSTPAQKDLMLSLLFRWSEETRWILRAWAILENHYHFVATAEEDAANLRDMLVRLHGKSSIELNRLDHAPGRHVWHQFWDDTITFQRSYLARLHYVNQNPVKHGLVEDALDYPWCSAAWFEERAGRAFRRSVERFKIDRVRVMDDF